MVRALAAHRGAGSARTEEEEEAIVAPKKKRGRQTKIRESDVPEPVKPVVAATPEKPARRTRQSIVGEVPEQQRDDSETAEPAATDKPFRAIVVPKRKRAGTRTTRAGSIAVKDVPEVDERESGRPNVRTRLSLVEAPVVEPEAESALAD